jgi:hypothetical protein
MCYTTRDKIRVSVEISSTFAFGTAGYRSDCRNVAFNDLYTINHDTGQKAWFKRQGRATITASTTNYYVTGSAFGLWTPFGVAPNTYSYQLGICDTTSNLGPGMWMSGLIFFCITRLRS